MWTVARRGVPEADALTDELQSFGHCVETGNQPVVGGREAHAVMQIAEEILRCVDAHQWDGRAAGRIGPNVMGNDNVRNRRAA